MQPTADVPSQADPTIGVPSRDALDRHFCRLTDQGHHALRGGDAEQAERCFLGALDEAERVFREAEVGSGVASLLAPMLLTVGCRNLAAARERSGDGSGARAHLSMAVERLLDAAENAGHPPVLRIACVRHLRYALGFLAEGGGELSVAVVERFAPRTKTVAAQVMRVASLCRSPAMQAPTGRLS